jgi:hypothetical protein
VHGALGEGLGEVERLRGRASFHFFLSLSLSSRLAVNIDCCDTMKTTNVEK